MGFGILLALAELALKGSSLDKTKEVEAERKKSEYNALGRAKNVMLCYL